MAAARHYARQVRRDAAEVTSKIDDGRGLFIDCGSNIGQAVTYFATYFTPSHFDYVLVEPNPHCVDVLERTIVPRYPADQIRVVAAAASTQDWYSPFYGLVEDWRGALSQGGSISKHHNTSMYQVDEASALTVPTFSFSEFVRRETAGRPAVVVKMDIESAEYDVLPDMLDSGTIDLVTLLYLEFHSRYMAEPDRTTYLRFERELLDQLDSTATSVRLWR